MPFAECFAGPYIQAALFGEQARQVCDSERERDQKELRRQHPKRKRTGTGVRRCSNPARTEQRCDIEQHEIPQPQFSP